MTPTLADLLADEALALSCVTGHALLNRPVARVHVAEVNDPTPWLTKDVLLLTTGLVDRTPAELDDFFAALGKCEIAAVGFGVGLMVDDIPQTWVAAARSHNIPLLSIPFATPYIAVSEFVSARLADRQLDQVRRMLEVQQRIAYSNATPKLQVEALGHLARELSASVFWLEEEGIRSAHVDARAGADPEPWTETDTGALDRAELRALSSELSRHVASGRASSSVSIGTLFLHIASTAGSPIAVARRRRYSPLEQGLIGSLATFIDLSRDTSALTGLASSLREQLITEAISGGMAAEPRLFEILFPGVAECTVIYLGPPPQLSTSLAREPAAGFLLKSFLATALSSSAPTAAPLLSTVDDGYYLIVPAAQSSAIAPAVSGFLRAETGPLRYWRAGVSSTSKPDDLLSLCAQARRAHHATSMREHGAVLLADELDHRELVTEWFRGSGEAPVFADWRARIAALDEAASDRILIALHAYLRENGALERAAAALGMHRQTLNTRLREVEDELSVSLSSPTDRSLLWLAFETGALPHDARSA